MKTELTAINDVAVTEIEPIVAELTKSLSTRGFKVADIDAIRNRLGDFIAARGIRQTTLLTEEWENALQRISDGNPALRAALGQTVLSSRICGSAAAYFPENPEIASFLRSVANDGYSVCQLTSGAS
jgi:hypothetical protein